MDIRVERGVTLGSGLPQSVQVILVDSKGEIKGTVEVYPVMELPPFSDTFKVEVRKLGKGGYVSPEIDVRLAI